MKPGNGHGSLKTKMLGRPKGGTVNALALTQNQSPQVFLGTEIGVYVLELSPDGMVVASKRLSSAPIGVLSLAVSPYFAEDQTIAAGTKTGVYISRDGGESWNPGKHALPDLAVLSICFSPAYRADGLILAGTLQDGVLVSGDRGYTWHNKNFGLLDSLVYSLSVSPHLESDGIVFAGTETALYFSYNHARAWKMLNFPVDAAPVLSLTLSPDFVTDGCIFAGTETKGLFRSSDQGETWQPVLLPAECVNVLSFEPDHAGLLAGTDEGLFRSSDQGATWELSLELPNVMSSGCGDGFSVAAAVEEGVWLCPVDGDWFPIENLSLRAMEGFVLSSQFLRDRTGYLYGTSEGIWKTTDGGETWDQIVSGIPGTRIFDMAVSQDGAPGQVLAFASDAGVFISADGGLHWKQLDKGPAELVQFSPGGHGVMAYGAQNGLCFSGDGGVTWQDIPGPWDGGGKIVNIALGSEMTLFIAYLEGSGNMIHIMEGAPGNINEVFKNEVKENLVVSFWNPAVSSGETERYFSMGERVYRLRDEAGGGLEETRLATTASDQVNLLDLTGVVTEKGVELYALSNHSLFHLKDREGWHKVFDFDHEHAVALSSIFQQDGNRELFILLLGGELLQVTITGHSSQDSAPENLHSGKGIDP